MSNRYIIILAAGQGTRMKSKLYKVLHPVCGKTMVRHVIEQMRAVEANRIVTVVGHGADKVKAELDGECEFVLQEEQLGTAHAVMQTKKLLKDKDGITLVACGDTPLLKAATIQALMEHHQKENAAVTVLTALAENPTGYGRIIRNSAGFVEKSLSIKMRQKKKSK